MPDVSIVIPVTDIRGEKNFNHLTNLLDSIRELKDVNNTIVCFDSCNPDFVKHFISSYKNILPIVNSKNRLQFARNANKGLRYAHSILNSSVLLVNQDCILPSESLGNWCNEGSLTCGTVFNKPDAKELTRINKEESRGNTLTEINTKFAFNCVYINKAVMDKIGYLDGSFICTFEDDDYIARARLAGFPCFQSDIKFYHAGDFIDSSNDNWESASGSYTQYNLQVNLMKFGTKYQIPPFVPHDSMLEWILEHHTWNEGMRVS